jgi:HPr kinase/phosphorylase
MNVEELYTAQGESCQLQLVAGKTGMTRSIVVPEVELSGLRLLGYGKERTKMPLFLFGKAEGEFLRDLPPTERIHALHYIIHSVTPCLFFSANTPIPHEIKQLCDEETLPLFRSSLPIPQLTYRLHTFLQKAFMPTLSCHGTLVEIFGVGVLLQGEPGIGKSEAALGLLARGHRLISDDIVQVQREQNGVLIGYGSALTHHHMEIRGMGIIDIASLYGMRCVKEKKSLDIVVKLEVWNDRLFYDRCGLKETVVSFLDIDIPCQLLPVTAGRDVVLLLETIALHHRSKILSLIEVKGNKDHGRKASRPKRPCKK